MRETRTVLWFLVTVSAFASITLTADSWAQTAGAPPQPSVQPRTSDGEGHQLERDCLTRKQADPTVDCSQFLKPGRPAAGSPILPGSAAPSGSPIPPGGPTLPGSPVPTGPRPASPPIGTPFPGMPTPAHPAPQTPAPAPQSP